MAKLPNLAASRIWRTVVVAGAMLGTPAIAVADTPPAKNAPAKNPCAPADTKKDDTKKDDTAKKDDTKKDTTKKDDTKKTDTAKKRPRSNGDDRPTGRGFILS
jgi:hypothetical protein